MRFELFVERVVEPGLAAGDGLVDAAVEVGEGLIDAAVERVAAAIEEVGGVFGLVVEVGAGFGVASADRVEVLLGGDAELGGELGELGGDLLADAVDRRIGLLAERFAGPGAGGVELAADVFGALGDSSLWR